MRNFNNVFGLKKIGYGLGLAIVGALAGGIVMPIQAQGRGVTPISNKISDQASIHEPFQSQLQNSPQPLPTPPDQGAPNGRQRGGATRGNCLAYQDLTALVPTVEGKVWSQTASHSPSFFFAVPTPLTSEVPLEFVIQDRDDNIVYHQEVAVQIEAGIVEISVAAEKADLVPGERYTWTLAIYCDAARPSASVSVNGSFNRVASLPRHLNSRPVTANTQTISPNETRTRIQQYAAAGLWHEAIQLAFELYQIAPGNADYAAPLDALLTSAGLADVSVSAPIRLPWLAKTTSSTTDL